MSNYSVFLTPLDDEHYENFTENVYDNAYKII